MPVRMIDGEALWQSAKLEKVPAQYQAEYANLIPLAYADGVFEAKPEIVWSKVYAVNRRTVTVADVKKILAAFEKAGMLKRKTDSDGKIWGKFVGIESRLPKGVLAERCKKSGTKIFDDDSVENTDTCEDELHAECMSTAMTYHSGLGVGFGLGKGEGRVRGEAGAKPVRLKTKLPELSFQILGVKAEHHSYEVWADIKLLEKTFGSARVAEEFEKWAEKNKGIKKNPLREFVNIAAGLITGIISLEKNQDAEDLAGEIASLTNARVLFTGKDKTDFVQLVDKCGKADTMAAFKKYWQNVEGDEFEEKHTARKFAEGGEYLVKAVRDEQKERERQAALAKWAEEETERLRVKAQEDLRKKQEAEEAERVSAIQAIADAFEVSFEEAAQMCSQSNAEAPPSDSLEDSKAQGQTILGSTKNA